MNRTLLILLHAITLGSAIRAQEMTGGVPQAPGHLLDAPGGRVLPPTRSINLLAIEPFDAGRVVTGAPYSAEAVTEITQTLLDGNRIEHRTSTRIARDGRGRIRREQQAVAVGGLVAEAAAPIITIADPKEGVFVTLDVARKVAMRSKPPGRDEPLTVRRTFGGVGIGAGILHESPGGSPGRPRPVPEGDVRTAPLGAQTLEGVRAEGTRTTTTIPAGAVGNQLPIEVVSERWYSPELQVVVLTRRSDPRVGETVYRLRDIVRAEPAPDLFEIPGDFRVEDAKPRIIRKP
jgi:hypothetical protein